jgi:hypothetical protein
LGAFPIDPALGAEILPLHFGGGHMRSGFCHQRVAGIGRIPWHGGRGPVASLYWQSATQLFGVPFDKAMIINLSDCSLSLDTLGLVRLTYGGGVTDD